VAQPCVSFHCELSSSVTILCTSSDIDFLLLLLLLDVADFDSISIGFDCSFLVFDLDFFISILFGFIFSFSPPETNHRILSCTCTSSFWSLSMKYAVSSRHFCRDFKPVPVANLILENALPCASSVFFRSLYCALLITRSRLFLAISSLRNASFRNHY